MTGGELDQHRQGFKERTNVNKDREGRERRGGCRRKSAHEQEEVQTEERLN